jgi:spermidine synthase
LVFHGQLSLERPAAKHLTLFFLCMSIGGALGGLFNGLFAPLMFNRFIELHIVLLGTSLWMILPLSTLMARSPDMQKKLTIATLVSMSILLNVCMNDRNRDWQLALAILVLSGLLARLLSLSPRRAWPAMALCLVFAQGAVWAMSDTIEVKRSFFSTHKVAFDEDKKLRMITHGNTVHGMQSSDPALSQQPLSYYHLAGPVGQAMRALKLPATRRYAVIGLGAGALATYCRQGATCDMFEIDPVVVEIARKHFTYLKDCSDTHCPVEIGDGRLLIEAKADATYDIIFLDAYNSDSIPIHLITKEALTIYTKKLKPGGLLFFHISNRYLDLRPVLSKLADTLGLRAVYTIYMPDDEAKKTHAEASDWMIMAREESTLAPLVELPGWRRLKSKPGEPLWTDDYSNILPVISPGGARSARGDE